MTWQNTDLDAYAHYWGTALGKSPDRAKRQMRDIRADVEGVWGSADDPLGAHTPIAQNAILKRLGKLAAGRIDDWESLVDPRLSPGENYALILERGGELPAEEKEEVRAAIAETVDAREQSRAASILRENVEAIDAGEKADLVDDIADEYGETFVDETLHAARIDAGLVDADDVDDAPAVTPNTDDADDAPTAAIDADDGETSTDDAPAATTADDVDAGADAGDAIDANEERESGDRARGTVRGLLRAAYAAVIVPYEEGRRAGRGDARPTTQS